MLVTRYKLDIVTDAGGNFTGYITPEVSGFFHQMRYVAGSLDTGLDLTITLEETAVRIFSRSNMGTTDTTYCPRHVVHDNDDGTELVHCVTGNGTTTDIDSTPVAVGAERIKVVAVQGGNAKSGKLYVWIVT